MGRRRSLVTVNCPTHHEALVNGLWNFYQTRHRTDLNYLGGGRSYRAHRLIVEVFLSPERLGQYFKPASASNDNGHAETVPSVPERGGIQLDCLLEFLYKGRVTVRRGQLKYLLAIAKELDLDTLAEAVELAAQRGGAAAPAPAASHLTNDVVEHDLEMVVDDEPDVMESGGSGVVQSDQDPSPGQRGRLDDYYELSLDAGQSGASEDPLEDVSSHTDQGTPRRTNRKRKSARVRNEVAERSTGQSFDARPGERNGPHHMSLITNHRRACPAKQKQSTALSKTEDVVDSGHPTLYFDSDLPDCSDPAAIIPCPKQEPAAYPVQLHANNNVDAALPPDVETVAVPSADRSNVMLCRLFRMSTEKMAQDMVDGTGHWMLHDGQQPQLPHGAFDTYSACTDRQVETSLSDSMDLLDSTAVATQAIHVRVVSEPEEQKESSSIGMPKRRPCECNEYGETLDGQRTNIIHTCERRYQCNVCGRAFFREKNLDRHALVHVADERRWTQDAVDTATKGWKTFVCGVCQKSFRKRATFNRHLLTHHETEPTIAETTPPTTPTLPKDRKLYKCPDCSRVFQRFRMFEKHRARHEDASRGSDQKAGDRRYTCDDCGRVFQRFRMFEKHRARHSDASGRVDRKAGERRHTCDECGKVFRRLGMFVKHRERHAKNGREGDVDLELENTSTATTGLHPCVHCGKTFKRLATLQRHVLSHAEEEEEVEVEQEEEKVEQTPNQVESKVSLAEDQFRCKVCGLEFAKSQELDRHSRSHGLTWVTNWTKNRTSGGTRPTNVSGDSPQTSAVLITPDDQEVSKKSPKRRKV